MTRKEFLEYAAKQHRGNDYHEFYSVNDMIKMLNNNSLQFTVEDYDCTQTQLLGRNVFEFGSNACQILSISERGQIFADGISPYCRNTLEYIHHVCQNLGDDVVWL